MYLLRKETINTFQSRPDLLSNWMCNLSEMREVLIKIFILHNIHGWQGLKIALSKFDFEFDVKDLIIFYSRYELDEKLLNMLLKLSLKLQSK
jgi:hypothetical protein